MSNAPSEAKNYLSRELGNQQRFLYEYDYVQIVDILEKGGFLRMPEDQCETKAQEEYGDYLKRTESTMAMSFEEFCVYYEYKHPTRESAHE